MVGVVREASIVYSIAMIRKPRDFAAILPSHRTTRC